MKKSLILAACALVIMGCSSLPNTRSVGISLISSPIDHRSDGSNEDAVNSVMVGGFAGYTGETGTLKDLYILGGNASATFRAGGFFSPFFFNAAVGGLLGRTHFGYRGSCGPSLEESPEGNVSYPYHQSTWDRSSSGYCSWLAGADGKQGYSVWNLQERIMVGADFNPGPIFFLGAALGVVAYQGYSDYDDARMDLYDRGLVEDRDGYANWGAIFATWLGLHLGTRGEAGSISIELDGLIGYTSGSLNIGFKASYEHPSGFFGGVSRDGMADIMLFAGRNFEL